ncbi:MAG: hypothetical protein J6D52_01050 [Clostridia bacterium]|nr:hypothetical protein [Clostridia bacterium]
MGIIQCAENCRYQRDGYCDLDGISVVNSLSGGCPYYIENLLYNGNSLSKTSDTDKL